MESITSYIPRSLQLLRSVIVTSSRIITAQIQHCRYGEHYVLHPSELTATEHKSNIADMESITSYIPRSLQLLKVRHCDIFSYNHSTNPTLQIWRALRLTSPRSLQLLKVRHCDIFSLITAQIQHCRYGEYFVLHPLGAYSYSRSVIVTSSRIITAQIQHCRYGEHYVLHPSELTATEVRHCDIFSYNHSTNPTLQIWRALRLTSLGAYSY
ncbi:hypothetical protein J6590_010511 [Homalodisca vitripennis]|nr:hypothetical protein J6590_010511 [Homalodisca vitripennis]